MAYETIELGTDVGIACILLNRPHQRNAMNRIMVGELEDVFQKLANDDSVKAILLGANGTVFSAGGDLSDHAATLKMPHHERRESVGAIMDRLAQFILSMLHHPKPIVAMVQGTCAGSSVGLACAADLVIAAENAKFVLAQTGVGLSIDGGTSYLLPRLIGHRKSLELALTGVPLTGVDAVDAGLVNQMVPPAELQTAGQALASRIASLPSGALRRSKALLWSNLDAGPHEALSRETAAVVDSFGDPQFLAGIEAFFSRKAS